MFSCVSNQVLGRQKTKRAWRWLEGLSAAELWKKWTDTESDPLDLYIFLSTHEYSFLYYPPGLSWLSFWDV